MPEPMQIRQGLMQRIGAIVALASMLAACASLPPAAGKPQSVALQPVADTAAANYLEGEIAAHRGLSGFRLLTRSDNALMSRIALIDHAAHSIDLQYYIFNNDPTGRLLAQRLLAAADRGVRVRILLDDINSGDSYPS